MALELLYYGHNVSMFGPDVALTGDPSIDNAAVAAAGFKAGVIVKLGASSNNPDGLALQVVDGAVAGDSGLALGAIITEPGEFANTIGPSGSNRISVARGLWVGNLYGSGFDSSKTYTIGEKLYPGTGAVEGCYTNSKTGLDAGVTAVGLVTHVPTTTEPWLGIASLL